MPVNSWGTLADAPESARSILESLETMWEGLGFHERHGPPLELVFVPRGEVARGVEVFGRAVDLNREAGLEGVCWRKPNQIEHWLERELLEFQNGFAIRHWRFFDIALRQLSLQGQQERRFRFDAMLRPKLRESQSLLEKSE